MDSKAMYLGVILGLAKMGVEIVQTKQLEREIIMYISVPSSSYKKDVNGIEMAGEHLAKRCKETLSSFIENPQSSRYTKFTLKMKIRDEVWTEEKAEHAVDEMKDSLYNDSIF